MADCVISGEYARQVRGVQPAPAGEDTALPVLRGAHIRNRFGFENARAADAAIGGEQADERGHAVAVRNHAPCGDQVIALGIKGLLGPCGKGGGVISAHGRQNAAHAVAVGQVVRGGDGARVIAGADAEGREHVFLHDCIKREIGCPLHHAACRACAQIAVGEGAARRAGQPVLRIGKQLFERAARLHAARAVIAVVVDGGGVRQQHAQGDRPIRRVGIAHGVAQNVADLLIKREQAALRERKRAEAHHQLAHRGDAKAGGGCYRHAGSKARMTQVQRLVFSIRMAKDERQADNAVFPCNAGNGGAERLAAPGNMRCARPERSKFLHSGVFHGIPRFVFSFQFILVTFFG